MTNLKINGIEHPLNDGFIIKRKYSEELNSATITIPFCDKLNLSPFDFVEITDDRIGNESFLIDTWVETTVSFKPLKYNYDVNLISETIKLQKVVMPNLSITQPIGRTPKSIATKLEEYYLTYIYPQYPELSLDESIYNLDIDCPEFEFNRPTAFELFNTILAKINSVVTIKNHKITYMRLDEYNKEIDVNKLYYDNNTQTIKDYSNRLDIQVSNGVPEKSNYSTIAGITVRAGENESLLNDDNMIVMLEKPIYDTENMGNLSDHAAIYVYVPYLINEQSKIAKIDITENVVEKAIYDTYLVSTKDEQLGYYKRNALYFVRGEKTIDGLSYHERSTLGNSSSIALYNIIRNKLKIFNKDAKLDFYEHEIRDYVFFQIDYKTNENFRFVVEKENDYNATLIDNQTETQVDILTFGKTEQDKINRLGNKNQIINAVYTIDEKIPNLGDYIGRYVLAETEIVYYKEYAIFKGYLYKDYVQKNLYYGLNSKKRSTQISTEALVRNDIVNYDVSFETERDGYSGLARYILQPLSLSGLTEEEKIDFGMFGLDYYEYPKYCFIYTYDNNLNSLQGENFILLTPSSFVCGKSNVIQFQFMDNYSAGIRLSGNTTGGEKQQYVPYVDDYGEFRGINFSLYTNKAGEFITSARTKLDLDRYREISKSLPLVTRNDADKIMSTANEILGRSKSYYKDNRETIAMSLNINYKDSDNVIIGNFAEYTGIGYRYNVAHYNIGIVYSTNYEYELGDEYGIGLYDETLKIDSYDGLQWVTSNGVINGLDNLKLNTSNKNISNWKSWAIIEKDTNRIILAVNKGNLDTVPTTIYLKIREKAY